MSKNTSLKQLGCAENQLTSLDVSTNTALECLLCENNQLTSLDVSTNTALIGLSCLGNQLTSLDLNKNAALLSLNCSGNQLTSLDLSNNTKLEGIVCSHNYLTPDTLTLPDGFAFGNEGTVPQYQKINTSAASYAKNAGDAAFSLGAKAKTALTYKSSNPGVAAVSSNGTISLKNAGEATITITAAATSQYKAATKTVKITVKPAVAKLTKIAPAARGLTITWNKVSSADGYYIARSVNGGAYKIIRNIAANGSVKAAAATLSYTDTTALANGARYSYKVLTYKVSGKNILKGAYSNAKSYYRISQPVTTRAANCCKGRITVNINRNTKVTGYQIMWSTDKFATYSYKTIWGNENTEYTIPNLDMNKTYYVKVCSFIKVGSTYSYSPWSTVRAIKTTNTLPNHLCG